MRLKRWQNLLNRDLRNDTNDNWQVLEETIAQLYREDANIRARLDNLVLNSGGDSSLEVVDARVGSDQQLYETLQARLRAEFAKIRDDTEDTNTKLLQFAATAADLQKQLKQLYGADQSDLYIYVDGDKGSDSAGEGSYEKPFRTITKGVSMIPLVVANKVYVVCTPAVYDEDVVIANINAPSIEVLPTNLETLEVGKPTGFYVRSIMAIDCAGYVRINGIDQMNTANSGLKLEERPVTLFFERVKYYAVNLCHFADKARSTNNITIYASASNGRVYFSHFVNQFECVRVNFAGMTTFSPNNTGHTNDRVLVCARSIVMGADYPVKADNPDRTYAGGQIF
ncbi:hypothetical protein NSQ26_13950 [Bacillus sp. FSL W7-1360]